MDVVSSNKEGIKQAVEVLKNGGVIVYPTDTAYGLGGIFDSKKVVSKVLKIKKRQDKKFTLVGSSLNQIEKFFKLGKKEKELAKKYWPGPFSIVISKNFSVRVPKNKLARNLARKAGKPLIATSANISGKKLLYDSKEIIKEFKSRKHQPDLIIDAGKIRKIKPSTLVRVREDKIEVLRKGPTQIPQI